MIFKHKSVRDSPNLSNNGQLHSGNKAALLEYLPNIPKPGEKSLRERATVVLFEMAAVVYYGVTYKSNDLQGLPSKASPPIHGIPTYPNML